MATLVSFFLSAPSLLGDAGMDLRKALMSATMKAFELEIDGYTSRLITAQDGTGPKENADRFTKKLEDLDAERLTYRSMKPEVYPAPAEPAADEDSILEQALRFGPVLPPTLREVAVTVDGPCADGTLLSVEGTSRSGPFYHLAGITGGDYGILEPGKRSRLTLCLVYRREYFGFIADYYVYVAQVQ